MFADPFVEKLFQPTEVYSDLATREVFNKLAHSSIMRLNKSSMDKLYDLMTMGLKQQVTQCRCPEEILDVTRNHIRLVRGIATEPAAVALLESFESRLNAQHGALSPWEAWQLRLTLMRFFQDRRVKVSIFLQELQQNLDGTFVVNVAGPMGPGFRPPGGIRYMGAEGAVSAERTVASAQTLGADGTIALGSGTSLLGLNMYARDRRSRKDSDVDDTKPKPWPGPNSSTATGSKLRGIPHALRGKPGSAAAEGAAAASSRAGAKAGADSPDGSPVAAEATAVSEEAAKAGLALLGTLIGSMGVDRGETMSLLLFPDEEEDLPPLSGEDDESGGVVVVNASSSSSPMADLAKSLGLDEPAAASGAGDEEEEDLLGLLDEAVG